MADKMKKVVADETLGYVAQDRVAKSLTVMLQLKLENIQKVHTHRVDDLNTQIRVVTRDQGTRYFNLKLSEMI